MGGRVFPGALVMLLGMGLVWYGLRGLGVLTPRDAGAAGSADGGAGGGSPTPGNDGNKTVGGGGNIIAR
jgi:hypothetical protein